MTMWYDWLVLGIAFGCGLSFVVYWLSWTIPRRLPPRPGYVTDRNWEYDKERKTWRKLW